MKFTIALFTLVVVCCAQTLAQGFGRIFRDPQHVPFPPFPLTLPPWNTNRPVTEWILNHRRVTDDFGGSTPPTIPGGGVGPGGLPFPVPGGLQEVTEITQEHMDLAKFAATEIGREYTLNNVTEVKTQVVAGINYHMDISVTKTKGLVETSLNCNVKIYHIVWMNEMTLEEFKCTRV